MNAVRHTADQCGCDRYFTRWLPGDFATAYSTWSSAPQFVQFLLGLGIPATSLTPLLPEGKWKDELIYCTDTCVYNAFVLLCRAVGHELPLQLLRSRFPFEQLVPRILEKLR